MESTANSRSSTARIGRIAGALVALGLVVGVLRIAGVGNFWRLLTAVDPLLLAAALALSALAMVLRGARLLFLLPAGHLSPPRAVMVAAATQAAALFIPLRLGELALPWLLRRLTGWDAATGVGTMLAVRTIDLACLGVWAAGGTVLLWGAESRLAMLAAVLLLLPPLLLPPALALLDRQVVRWLAPRGLSWRRWAHRARRLTRSVAEVQQRPGRLVLAVLSSLAMWGTVWSLTWVLVRAMGLPWPLLEVVAGSAVASLANLVPVNLVANLGTLEAGWTAVFSALGHPVEEAAASGLASHLWALLFAALYGGAAWIAVSRTSSGEPGE